MSIVNLLAKAGLGAATAFGGMVAKNMVKQAAEGVAGTALDKAVSAVVQQLSSGAGSNYIRASSSVRIEPFTLIDDRAARLPYIRDVLNTAQRLFTAYYLLSVAADNTIGSVRVSKHLDKFAPDRDLQAATLSFLSNESYQFGLPFVGEAAGLDRYSAYCTEDSRPGPDNTGNSSVSVGTNTAKAVQDIQNLAVGQIVDLTISKDGKEGKVPVMIRLRTIGMAPSVMKEVLALGGEDQSRSAQLRQWRMGEKSLVGDLFLGQDRIRRYRAAAMADKSGYFRKVHQRANRNWVTQLLSGTPSIGTASSIAITTTDTIREVELQISGKFSNFETRQGVFEDSLMMIVMVIDEDHETVTVYTRDIEDAGTYTLKELKGSSNNSNSDLADIMRSYMEGRVPGRL